jgi:two-component system response regulator HydG
VNCGSTLPAVSDVNTAGNAELRTVEPVRVLIIDDDESLARALARMLTVDGVVAQPETQPLVALDRLVTEQWDVVLLDVNMPTMSGLDVLGRIRGLGVPTSVVMLTADDSAGTAASAMRNGAFHYLTKPVRPLELSAVVEGAARYAALERRSRRLEKQFAQARSELLIGRTAAMLRVQAAIEKLSQSAVSILILGESGTGKELVARALHELSPRRDRPFVAINCGSIPETLIDSELFGHSKGAFTGASSARPGVFVEADGGTLFLDEIGDMPLQVQARLLRVLQEGEVRPVGGQGQRPVDVRVVAATHVDLQKAVDERRFRSDLFYRLNVVTLSLPPLRERIDDLPLLTAHFVRKHGGASAPRLAPAAFEALSAYSWPGNVRELENAILHAVSLARGDVIDVDLLPRRVIEGVRPGASSNSVPPGELGWADEMPLTDAKRRAANDFEKRYLLRVLERAHGTIAEAARMAGLDRSNFRRLLQRHGIDASRMKDEAST